MLLNLVISEGSVVMSSRAEGGVKHATNSGGGGRLGVELTARSEEGVKLSMEP